MFNLLSNAFVVSRVFGKSPHALIKTGEYIVIEKVCRRRWGKGPGFRCTETGHVYEEFKGGFSWPGGDPGFLCVVGQEAGTGTLHSLEECFEDNMLDLARKCITIQRIYPVPGKRKRLDWITLMEGEYRSFMLRLMDIGDSEGQAIWLENPTISWDLTLAAQIVRQEIMQNSLSVLKNEILQDQIKNLNREINLKNPDMLVKYAPIMVLASVIAERGLQKDRIEKFENPNRWGPFGGGSGGGSWMSM
jgi:hypothetical protein